MRRLLAVALAAGLVWSVLPVAPTTVGAQTNTITLSVVDSSDTNTAVTALGEDSAPAPLGKFFRLKAHLLGGKWLDAAIRAPAYAVPLAGTGLTYRKPLVNQIDFYALRGIPPVIAFFDSGAKRIENSRSRIGWDHQHLLAGHSHRTQAVSSGSVIVNYNIVGVYPAGGVTIDGNST